MRIAFAFGSDYYALGMEKNKNEVDSQSDFCVVHERHKIYIISFHI